MRDFAFYNAGVDDAKGPKLPLGLARRLVRRLLRPMLFRQEAIYRDLQEQIDRLSEEIRGLDRRTAATDAFGWDYVAMARRLAALEDHLLHASGEPAGPSAPGLRLDPPAAAPAPHSASGRPAPAVARAPLGIGAPGPGTAPVP